MKSIIKYIITILVIFQIIGVGLFAISGTKFISNSDSPIASLPFTRLPGQRYCQPRSQITEGEYLDTVPNVHVYATLNRDGSLSVREEISIYLNGRHGIYRFIPTLTEANFGNNNFYVTRSTIEDFSIYRYGVDEPVSLYTSYDNGVMCNISGVSDEQSYISGKIGSQSVILSTGTYTYNVSYVVKDGLVKDQSGNLALYWNFWGNKWYANIDNYDLQLTVPSSSNILNGNCYVGLYGEDGSGRCYSTQVGNTYSYNVKGLTPYEGVTILSRLKDSTDTSFTTNLGKQIVPPANSGADTLRLIADIAIGILTFIPSLIAFIIYRRSGVEKKGRGVIVPEYIPPNDMSPAQAGTIVDQSVDKTDMSAVIISLCVKGWMKIEEKAGFFGIGKTYDFIKTDEKPNKVAMSEEEESVFTQLFELGSNKVSLSDLQSGRFAQIFTSLKDTLYAWSISNGYLTKSPELGLEKVVIVIFTVICGWIVFMNPNIIAIISLTISVIVSYLFLKLFSVFTEKGKLEQEKVLGFKMYLGTAEKNQLEFLNDPNNHDMQTFEKYLPYAMALGVTKIWTDKFKDVFTSSPDWYVGPNFITFNAMNFSEHLTDSLSSFSSAMNTAASMSSSSGGGFSGGGGGGGGGGSW